MDGTPPRPRRDDQTATAATPPDRPPAGETVFQPVRTSPTSAMIVDQIKALIRRGALRPGDRLPNQREMCRLFGVSPVLVREALRVLGASGLVVSRLGPSGGATVTSPSAEHIVDGLTDLVLLSPTATAQAIDVRMLIELGALSLVVERATRADIDELNALADEGRVAARAGEYAMEMSIAFHTRLVECARVPMMAALFQSFHSPLLTHLRATEVGTPTMVGIGNEEHRLLVQAIEQRDLPAAHEVMVRHLERSSPLPTARREGARHARAPIGRG